MEILRLLINPLSDYIQKFNPDKVSRKDLNKISDGCAEIVKDFCKDKNFPVNEEDVIAFDVFVGGIPKSIMIAPKNASTGMLLSYYSEKMKVLQRPL